jgi:hypothetical protein
MVERRARASQHLLSTCHVARVACWVISLVSAEHDCRMGCHHDRHDKAEGDDEFKSTRRRLAGLVVNFGQMTTIRAPGLPPFAHILSSHQGVRLFIQEHERWQTKVAAD